MGCGNVSSIRPRYFAASHAIAAKRGEKDRAARPDRDATTYPDMANLRTGSLDAVLPCFCDAAVPRRATAGR